MDSYSGIECRLHVVDTRDLSPVNGFRVDLTDCALLRSIDEHIADFEHDRQRSGMHAFLGTIPLVTHACRCGDQGEGLIDVDIVEC